MSEERQQPESSESFRTISTRRAFMARLLAVGGAALGATAGAAMFGYKVAPVRAASNADIVNFGNAAVGAERIGIAFYSNALGEASQFSNGTKDLAKGVLLNSGHRTYFMAARNQETQHLATLLSVPGLGFGFSVFGFPAGTFDSARAMVAFGEQLESVFIGAYLGAVQTSAAAHTSLGDTVAELAAQILGVECEHRVLIRDIAGLTPPNDRFFEGDQSATPPDTTLGNTGVRSTVYASGDAAVNALIALGITPIS